MTSQFIAQQATRPPAPAPSAVGHPLSQTIAFPHAPPLTIASHQHIGIAFSLSAAPLGQVSLSWLDRKQSP